MNRSIGEKPGRLATFLREYARKKPAPMAGDPNDRRFSLKLRDRIRRLKPEEMQRLMNEDDKADAEAKSQE